MKAWGDRQWSTGEKAALHDMIEREGLSYDAAAASGRLQGRTHDACKHMGILLGLVHSCCWTAEQDAALLDAMVRLRRGAGDAGKRGTPDWQAILLDAELLRLRPRINLVSVKSRVQSSPALKAACDAGTAALRVTLLERSISRPTSSAPPTTCACCGWAPSASRSEFSRGASTGRRRCAS